MSLEITAYLKGYVDPKEIYQFIKQKIDENAICEESTKTFGLISEIEPNEYYDYVVYGNNDKDYQKTANICFVYNGKTMHLIYCYDNVQKIPKQIGNEIPSKVQKIFNDIYHSETTELVMYCCDDSYEILLKILKHFDGGWIYSEFPEFAKVIR